jgi:hypothetical protein
MVCTAEVAWEPKTWYKLGYAMASEGPLPPLLKPLPLAPVRVKEKHVIMTRPVSDIRGLA